MVTETPQAIRNTSCFNMVQKDDEQVYYLREFDDEAVTVTEAFCPEELLGFLWNLYCRK